LHRATIQSPLAAIEGLRTLRIGTFLHHDLAPP
jgi:hypothetical protein